MSGAALVHRVQANRGRPLHQFNVAAIRNVFPWLLVCGSFLFSLGPAIAAEIPFEMSAEFPPSAYSLIADKRVVWFGEMHGTREAPELLLGLLRLVSRHVIAPPVVALEIPTTEQRAIDGYLENGDEALLR